jgi:hypothetical protein
MNSKQWRSLVTAGLMSGMLMADVVYGESAGAKPETGVSPTVSSDTAPKKKRTVKHKKAKKKKEVAPAQTPS